MSDTPFSQADRRDILAHGVAIEDAQRQLSACLSGTQFARLLRPCTIGDGIRRLSVGDAQGLAALFEAATADLRVAKFVPASGAASRMFGSLLATADKVRTRAVAQVVDGLGRLALRDDLEKVLAAAGHSLESLLAAGEVATVVDYIVGPQGLGYSSLPKALLKFHAYGDHTRTAFEEHLVEASVYAVGARGLCRLHFTVSEEHRELFEDLLEEVRKGYEDSLGVGLAVEFSSQKASTDAVAVDEDGRPFRRHDGTLLFRPGGHGALLANLALCEADVVFVKNIDNIVVDSLRAPTYLWKKALGGLLLELRERVFAALRRLGDKGDEEAVTAALRLANSEFGAGLDEDPAGMSLQDRIKLATAALDRPIRVCGMVPAAGEPGGGPFWVQREGRASCQIVETSQVDPDNDQQRDILATATHFNPVDLVCSTSNAAGEVFDLDSLVDESAFFVVERSSEGRRLRSVERPGLWNGVMAAWNTVFVEVPAATFNPVKTLADLLSPAHQGP